MNRDAGASTAARRAPLPVLASTVLLAAALVARPPAIAAHGYLQTPRSRNLVAYQDMETQRTAAGDPAPEYCPHCLNRGGTLAQCGILFGKHRGVPWERNYDRPLSATGEPMPPNIQGVYKEGSVIEVEVLLTTHHKGHFEFSVCPIEAAPMAAPTAACFAAHKLEFVADELYGAPPDPRHPERAYLAPASRAGTVGSSPGVRPVAGARYKMTLRLPSGIAGDVMLLQWHYLTANSCKHAGYAEYPFPEDWGKDVALYSGLPDCGELPPDGNGVPEQFWNCAEIKIVGKVDKTTPASRPSTDAPDVPATAHPTTSPTPFRPEPTAPPVPFRPCRESAGTYYEATEDCAGYYVCAAGVQGETYYCSGRSMLYNQATRRCDWAHEVSCGAGSARRTAPSDDAGVPWIKPRGAPPSGGPPTLILSPTGAPAPRPPNALLEWTQTAAGERGHNKTVIAYYASWQWYDRQGLAAPAAFDWDKVTRVNFAFFQITPQGDIFGTDNWADPITLFGFFDYAAKGTAEKYCSWDAPGMAPSCMSHKFEEGLLYLAHQAGAEVYPSLGGWSLSDAFPAMAADRKAREHFARQCVELIRSYGFDGIDLDWEYPGYAPHAGTPADTVNFNLLLNDVRAALDGLGEETGQFYGLTAALPCGPLIIDNMNITHVSKLLTELNLMTYDFHGIWNNITGVNAPLYDQKGSPDFSVHGCVNNWLKGGAPQEKINIGFPFYGRSFSRATHLYEPHSGKDDSAWHIDEGVPQYYNIMAKINGWTNVRDEQTMTQYMYGQTGMVSYDDERAICDKTEYAQDHDLNGYIIWEISGDLMPDLSTPLLDAANAKLLDPTMDCASRDLSSQINAIMEKTHPKAGTNTGGENSYYPARSKVLCKNDGQQADWLKPSDLFGSAESCCEHHFSWNTLKCLENSPDLPPILQAPRRRNHKNMTEEKVTRTEKRKKNKINGEKEKRTAQRRRKREKEEAEDPKKERSRRERLPTKRKNRGERKRGRDIK